MKEISQLVLPKDVLYTRNHEWVRREGNEAVVGITDYAQDQLGEIVFAELPAVGDTFGRGAAFGTLESVKAVSEIYTPVAGEILATNEELRNDPGRINTDPYGKGCLIRLKPAAPADQEELMDPDAYLEMVKGKK
jgi:glycine cleavage system H protein